MCLFFLIGIIVLILYFTGNLPGSVTNSIDDRIEDINYSLDYFKKKDLTIGGYYQSWSVKWSDNIENIGITKLPSYLNRVYISFANPDMNYRKGYKNLSGTGLNFPIDFDMVAKAINRAKEKNTLQKFILAVGGATYHFSNVNYQSIIDLMEDMNLDGIDIDYENNSICSLKNTNSINCNTDREIENIIRNFREKMGNGKILSVAAFSVGAYCNYDFPDTKFPPISDSCGMWVNPLKNSGRYLDELNIMSYDSGPSYSPLDAFNAYKKIFNRKINLGIQIPPEAWGGDVMTVEKALKNAEYIKNNYGGGVFIWSLNKEFNELTANNFLSPICKIYGLSECDKEIPLN